MRKYLKQVEQLSISYIRGMYSRQKKKSSGEIVPGLSEEEAGRMHVKEMWQGQIDGIVKEMWERKLL